MWYCCRGDLWCECLIALHSTTYTYLGSLILNNACNVKTYALLDSLVIFFVNVFRAHLTESIRVYFSRCTIPIVQTRDEGHHQTILRRVPFFVLCDQSGNILSAKMAIKPRRIQWNDYLQTVQYQTAHACNRGCTCFIRLIMRRRIASLLFVPGIFSIRSARQAHATAPGSCWDR